MASETLVRSEPEPPTAAHNTDGRELVLEQVEVVYERVFLATHGVSLCVPAGGIVGLLGSNGAGKSTTLRAISGFLRSERAAVTAGSIRYGEKNLVGRAPHRVAREGIVMVPERDKVFASLSVKENIEIGEAGAKRRPDRAELFDRIYEYFPILRTRGSQKAGYLSGGERQMLAMARALVRRPTLLMIDELSLGLAPKVVDQLAQILRRINDEQGTSILFVEQNANTALDVADFVYIMESGLIVMEGSSGELRGRSDVQELYLGMGEQDIRSYGEVRHHTKAERWWG